MDRYRTAVVGDSPVARILAGRTRAVAVAHIEAVAGTEVAVGIARPADLARIDLRLYRGCLSTSWGLELDPAQVQARRRGQHRMQRSQFLFLCRRIGEMPAQRGSWIPFEVRLRAIQGKACAECTDRIGVSSSLTGFERRAGLTCQHLSSPNARVLLLCFRANSTHPGVPNLEPRLCELVSRMQRNRRNRDVKGQGRHGPWGHNVLRIMSHVI